MGLSPAFLSPVTFTTHTSAPARSSARSFNHPIHFNYHPPFFPKSVI